MCVVIAIASYFNAGGGVGHGRYRGHGGEGDISRELYQEAGVACRPIALSLCFDLVCVSILA